MHRKPSFVSVSPFQGFVNPTFLNPTFRYAPCGAEIGRPFRTPSCRPFRNTVETQNRHGRDAMHCVSTQAVSFCAAEYGVYGMWGLRNGIDNGVLQGRPISAPHGAERNVGF
ncbi:hypothetical protein Barb4_03437 [Bacteroidales bacterium Barb4]|nr:hypothetical protein Barb4_03437 [Bacteroidales bacterium Barb4]